MPARRRPGRRSLPLRATELAFAVPQVVGHRLARMAAAGASPSARDRREFERMVNEKAAAFGEAWLAMAWQTLRAQQAMWWSWAWSPALFKAPSAAAQQAMGRRLQRAALTIAGHGLAPVHRTAVANARRLARTKRR